MLTATETQQVDEAAKEILRTQKLAVAWADDKEGGLFSSFTLSDVERAIIKNIRDNVKLADRWFEQSEWAERGTDDDGYTFTVQGYLDAGKVIAEAFAFHLKESVHTEVFTLTVKQTAADVQQKVQQAADAAQDAAFALDKLLKSPWLKWGLAGLGVVAAVVAVKVVTAPVRKAVSLVTEAV